MGRTRRGLLDGAARAFAELGLRAATMQSIARAAGVAKATLYNHFRTKDDVARALLAAELGRVCELARGRPATEALVVLAEEVARHPVLRRLRDSDPELLLRLLAAGEGGWSGVVDRIAATVPLAVADAELVGRWLVGLVLQPGTAQLRRQQAAALLGSVDEGAGDGAPSAPAWGGT